MTKERGYQELYDRLLEEVAALHRNNRRRIRIGMRMLLVVTLGLMLLMFLAEGNKVFTLMLWILSMFAVAAYLIAVEYADYELQKKLEKITEMERVELGALLELPGLPKMPRLPDLRYHGRREETAASAAGTTAPQETQEPEDAAQETAPQAAEVTAEEPVYSVEDILREVKDQPQEKKNEPLPQEAAHHAAHGGAQVLERLLEDPERLAGELEQLTHALQGLSDDLRRSAADRKDGEVDR